MRRTAEKAVITRAGFLIERKEAFRKALHQGDPQKKAARACGRLSRRQPKDCLRVSLACADYGTNRAKASDSSGMKATATATRIMITT